jgi:hypothetical protein
MRSAERRCTNLIAAIKPKTGRYDIGEVIGSALERASRVLAQHKVEVDVAPDSPMLDIDPVLFEQVLFNLLDNAENMPRQALRCSSKAGRRRIPSSSRLLIKAAASRPTRLGPSLRSFIASRRGPDSGRHRAGACDLARLCRGHGWDHRRWQPFQPAGRSLHYHLACFEIGRASGYGRTTAAPLRVLVFDDEPPIRRLLLMGLGTQGLPNPRRAQWQGGA